MSFSLGQAKLILDANAEPLINTTSKAYANVQLITRAFTKYIADQNNVRVKDVKEAVSEILKEERKLADDRRRITQDTLKVYQQQYKQEEDTRKARARSIINEEKAIERERIASVQRQFREEAKIRSNADKLRKDTERQQARGQGTQSSFIRGIPGDIATIAGFGAIASGAIIVREALVTLVDATREQEQAQRSLNAAFGETQLIFKNNADSLAKQFNLVSSATEQAVSRFGVLQNQTALTGEQILKLNKIAIENQAAFGGDLLEAHRSIAGAILGETEAYEKYGVVLQEGVLKSSSKLTEEERRRFTTMSESEKQLIRYRIILEESNKVQGSAAQRAKDTQGGFDALNRSVNELAKSLGSQLVPAAGEGARELAKLTSAANALLEEYVAVNKAIDETERARAVKQTIAATTRGTPFGPIAEIAGTVGNVLVNQEEIRRQRALAAEQAYRDLELANIKQHNKDVEKLEQDARNREEAQLKEARTRIEASLKAAHDVEIKRINERIKAAEYEQHQRLEALESRHKSELSRLEQQEEARQRAAADELDRINKEKDAALQAIDDRKDAELEGISAAKEAARDAAEEQIRLLNIEKEARKRINDDLRDSDLRTAETIQDNELERLENEQEARARVRIAEDRQIKDSQAARDREIKTLREKEDREIEDSLKRKDRKLDDAHTKVLRRLEREAEKLRSKAKGDSDSVEKQIDEEDEQHKLRMRQIDDEAEAQTKIIDKQIDGINEVQRAREAARRREGISEQIAEAHLNVRRATGSQDPAARVGAQQKLVGAIRIGDPVAIKKAQEELVEIVGQGQEAIAKAQKELADVQTDLRDNDLKEAEDAEIQKLETAKDTIADNKKAEERQETERNERRRKRLDADKDSEQERLDDSLAKIERKQEKEEDAFKKAQRQQEDLTEFNSRQLEDRREKEDEELKNSREAQERQLQDTRKAEDQAHEDSVESTRRTYEEQTELINDRHEAEQRAIQDTYDSEATGYIPAIRRALDATEKDYDAMRKAAEKRYDAEKRIAQEHFAALIKQHQDLERDARTAYERTVEAASGEYERARKAIQEAYRHPDGTSGIIDQLDNLKEATDEKLAEVLESFRLHALGLIGEGGYIKVQWETALTQAQKYFDYIDAELKKKRTTPAARPTPNQPSAPGGGPPQTPGGIQVGPDPGPGNVQPLFPGSSGIGTAPDAPGTTPTTGSPDPERGGISIDPDDVSNMFTTSFGYGLKYSNPTYPETPGWKGGAVWAGGPSHHKGIDLILPGPNNGYGKPIPAFHGGHIIRTAGDSRGPGGNMLIIEDNEGNTHWYLHLKDYVKTSGPVKRGDIIAHLGDTGTKEFPHLHYEVRKGDNNGPMSYAALLRDGIDPTSYIKGRRDEGYMFNNPTMYEDLRTGERGVMAERGPERLLGRRATQQFDSMGLEKNLRSPNVMQPNYMTMGAELAGMQTVAQSTNHEGDKFNYYGVAPDDVIKKWRDDQRKQRILRGSRGVR